MLFTLFCEFCHLCIFEWLLYSEAGIDQKFGAVPAQAYCTAAVTYT